MDLSVNGQSMSLDHPCRVSDLLERLEIAQRPCAVEVNRNLVPRPQHHEYLLSEGDQVEIVTLVGGG